jgi:DNA-binding NtrC family response regulator
MALPVLIEGAAGTGRSRAARYLHRASNPSGAPLREIEGSHLTPETCAEIARSVRGGRRGPPAETFVIEGIEHVPADMQERLARALEEGLLAGGPRVLAVAGRDGSASLRPALRFALSTLTVRTPSVAERPSDRFAIANALLSVLSARMRLPPPELDSMAVAFIERCAWPGNLQQMRSVLGATLAARRQDGPLSGTEIEAQFARIGAAAEGTGTGSGPDLDSWIEQALAGGSLSVDELENQIYRAAIARTQGNLSAAARLVGLSRAQLAYRLGASGSPAGNGSRDQREGVESPR